MKEIRREVLSLKKNLKQEVIIIENKKMLLFARKGKIYADENFWNRLNKGEKISAIYHERGHINKIGKGLIYASSIFEYLSAFSLAVIIVFSLFYLTHINYLFIFFANYISYLSIIFLFSISVYALLRWLSETICDANAIKNGKTKSFYSALNKCYRQGNRNRNFLERFENNFLSHVPRKLRFGIVKNLERG